MRAYVLQDINNLTFETKYPKPKLKDGEVLVMVMAAGICGSDIPRIYKNGAHKHPIVIGHEFAGIVIEAKDSEGEKWIGKRVGVFPLIPCKECSPCINKQYQMCRHYNYLGSRCDGGYADYVAVPIWNLIELTENITFEVAAMMEPMAVATHAVRGLLGQDVDKNPDTNKNILVWGIGTIGIMIVMMLKELGYTNLYAIGNKESQVEILVEKFGISKDNICNTTEEDPFRWIASKNVDIQYAFECVGKNETLDGCIDMVSPAGNIMLVGNPYSDMNIPQATYWKILRNELTVKGTWNSSFTHDEDDDWNYLAKLLEEDKLCPECLITHKYKLEDLVKGFELMRDKKEPYIKCMWVV